MSAPALVQFIQGITTPSADNLNGMAQTCDTFADLQAFVGTVGMQIIVRGQYAVADGGQGMYYWNPGATQPGDSYYSIIPYGSMQGGWIRMPGPFMAESSALADGPDFTTPSANFVMAGENVTITPVSTGRVLVFGQATIFEDATGAGTFVLYYGTGAPPNSGDSPPSSAQIFTGELFTRANGGPSTSPYVPMTLVGLLTGLIVGTAYWLDFGVLAAFGGNVTITRKQIIALEL